MTPDPPRAIVTHMDEALLPPTPAREAGPYLRDIFRILNDPWVPGITTTSEYYVPPELREWITGYLLARDIRVKFFNGQLTQKAYLTVGRGEDA